MRATLQHVMKKLCANSLVALLGVAALDASAVTPMGAAQLSDSCSAYIADASSDNGIHCVYYITGFLDGAVATDERVALNVATEIEREESFSQRALRTRVGGHLRKRGASYYAEYCIGDPVPVREVIELVVAEFARVAATPDTLARDVVYAALRSNYPCSQPAS
jgi:hypothetical protein